MITFSYAADCIYYKFTGDMGSISPINWGFSFTVTGGGKPDNFDTGYSILNMILNIPTVVKYVIPS